MKKNLKVISLLTLMVIIVTIFAGCKNTSSVNKPGNPQSSTKNEVAETDKYGGTFIWPVSSDPKTMLYAFASTGTTNKMGCLINDKLFVIDEKGKITYRMCESINKSDDGLSYTFKLRPNIKWHDGTTVLASDIVWTINIRKDPDWFRSTDITIPGNWEAVDDLTCKVTLDKPDSNLLYTIQDNLSPQPEHYYKGVKPSQFLSCEQAKKPIGCGPFKFVDYKVGDYILVERNDSFYGGKPYLDKAILKITGGNQYSEIAFETQQVSAYTCTYDYYEEIKNNDSYKFLQGTSSTHACVDCTANKNYMASDRRLREAVAYMINYDDITNKIFRGSATRSYSAFALGDEYYTEEGMPKYTYDIDKANKLLDDAGWKDTDGDGIRNFSNGKNMKFKLMYSSPGSVQERMIVLLAEAMDKCGLKAVPFCMESNTWLEKFLAKDQKKPVDTEYEESFAVLDEWGYGPYAASFAERYTSTGGSKIYVGNFNKTNLLYSEYNKDWIDNQLKLDDLFKKAKESTDPKEAQKNYEEAQRVIIKDMIWEIPICSTLSRIAFQKNVHFEDCMWFTNNNYLGFTMEKLWIQK